MEGEDGCCVRDRGEKGARVSVESKGGKAGARGAPFLSFNVAVAGGRRGGGGWAGGRGQGAGGRGRGGGGGRAGGGGGAGGGGAGGEGVRHRPDDGAWTCGSEPSAAVGHAPTPTAQLAVGLRVRGRHAWRGGGLGRTACCVPSVAGSRAGRARELPTGFSVGYTEGGARRASRARVPQEETVEEALACVWGARQRQPHAAKPRTLLGGGGHAEARAGRRFPSQCASRGSSGALPSSRHARVLQISAGQRQSSQQCATRIRSLPHGKCCHRTRVPRLLPVGQAEVRSQAGCTPRQSFLDGAAIRSDCPQQVAE